jgi:hypothetical protein
MVALSRLKQAAALTLLLPQDADGRLGPTSRQVTAAAGGGGGSRSHASGGVPRRQLLRCVAQFYAAQLTPEAHEAAMQVVYMAEVALVLPVHAPAQARFPCHGAISQCCCCCIS